MSKSPEIALRRQLSKMRGMVAILPQVPGAKGESPDPNHDEINNEIFPHRPDCLKASRKVKLSDCEFGIKKVLRDIILLFVPVIRQLSDGPFSVIKSHNPLIYLP